jgi:hypothetical protein
VEEPPQLDSPPKVELTPKIDRGDQKLEYRPEIKRGLREQRGGPFISPYTHFKHKDPSRQGREDQEQFDRIRKLRERKREIDKEIRDIRNQDTRVNPYNVGTAAEKTFQQMLSDLRNMEQDRWSGNLSGFYGYSPLHELFRNQFGIAEEEDAGD